MTHNEILSLLVTGMLCYGLFDAGCVSVEMLRALCVCVCARAFTKELFSKNKKVALLP